MLRAGRKLRIVGIEHIAQVDAEGEQRRRGSVAETYATHLRRVRRNASGDRVAKLGEELRLHSFARYQDRKGAT
jgi:hypothetical protein